MARILAFSGSVRRDSVNSRLLKVVCSAVEQAGGAVTRLDLSEYPLPIYHGDEEQSAGLPAAAKALKEVFLNHHGLLIASPEYNSSLTPLLKNVIDWVSRPLPGEAPLAAYRGKVAALCAASPGALGGLRGLVHLRAILGNIGVLVLPDQLAVPRAPDAFGEGDGRLKDDGLDGLLRRLASELVRVTQSLHGSG